LSRKRHGREGLVEFIYVHVRSWNCFIVGWTGINNSKYRHQWILAYWYYGAGLSKCA
jgi:hypothetical protein